MKTNLKVINHREKSTYQRLGWKIIYVGRPTILGNPFKSGRDGTRDEVCDAYMEHLRRSWRSNTQVRNKLKGIARLVESGQRIALQCYCHPKRCHADEIAKAIEGIISKEVV